MEKYTEESFYLPGFTIAAKKWENGSKRRMLAFHGWLDNAASFDFLAPLLKDSTLIAIDSPGCGLSSHYPPGYLPQFLDEPFLMFHLVNQLGWETFELIGHSRGAGMAIGMAIAAPERVEKMVLIDTIGTPRIDLKKSLSNVPAVLDNYFSASLRDKAYYPSIEAAIQARMNSSVLSYSSAKALTLRGVKDTPEGFVWRYDRLLSVMTPTFMSEEAWDVILGGLQCPVCLIMGTEGLRYSKEVLKRRCKMVKDLLYVEVQGGHHLHMDKAEEVAKVIANF